MAFIAFNFDIVGISYHSLENLFSYIDQQISQGQAFLENLGMLISANQAMDEMTNYLHNNAVASDYFERSMLTFWAGILASITTLILGVLTIKSLKENHRYKKSKLSAFFWTSSIVSSITMGLLIVLYKAANDVDSYKQEVDSLMLLYWFIGCAISFGILYLYYDYKYKTILDKAYDLKPFISHTLSNNTTYPYILSAEKKATKTCPYCGETILAVAVKCKHCGEWFPKEEEKKMIECKVCGEKVQEGIDECPYCHEKIDGSSMHSHQSETKTIICPICAEQIPDNVCICPMCNEKIK